MEKYPIIKSVNDVISAIKTNGKSKSVEDYNILDEYMTRFNEYPSILMAYDDNYEFFNYDKFIKELKDIFENSKVLFSFNEVDLESGKRMLSRQIWYIKNGYLLSLWISKASNLYANPKIDVKMDSDEQIIQNHSLLIPPDNSTNIDRELEDRVINLFKKNILKEEQRNAIGMITVESTGELYVKQFSLNKKFKIKDLNINYGDDFKVFHDKLFKKLKTDKKGLVLLHGSPGTGKCVHGKTKVIIRNKNTGEIKEMNIEDLM